MSVLERIARVSRHDIQRIGLSATVGNPEVILTWLQGTSRRSGKVVDPPKKPGRRQLLVVYRPGLAQIAEDAAEVAKGGKSLFFCQSRSVTEAVAENMRRAGTSVFVHHSAVSREERQLAEERFHRGSDACIVCTSTLELGIDVGDLDRVLQAEAPDTVSSFLQRMGRTGRRAGQVANTTFFCETSEGVLQAIALIELAKSGWVESVDVSQRCWPVLIHQLLALSLANDGITAEAAWSHLSRVPDFRGITRDEFDRLIAWMLQDGSLVLASGQLTLGPKAEKRFGRRNFMELYAVFSSPQSYAVQTQAGQPLGTLNQSFVDQLVDDVSCFLLAGRPWVVLQIQHDERRVIVDPAPRGRQPTWGGYLPQFLSFPLCQKILEVLTSSEVYGYLTPEAATVLHEERAKMQGVLKPGHDGIEISDGQLQWWTFAGGRINSTLRYALSAIEPGWSFIPDNFSITIRGDTLNIERFLAARQQTRQPRVLAQHRILAKRCCIASQLPPQQVPTSDAFLGRAGSACCLSPRCRWCLPLAFDGNRPRHRRFGAGTTARRCQLTAAQILDPGSEGVQFLNQLFGGSQSGELPPPDRETSLLQIGPERSDAIHDGCDAVVATCG